MSSLSDWLKFYSIYFHLSGNLPYFEIITYSLCFGMQRGQLYFMIANFKQTFIFLQVAGHQQQQPFCYPQGHPQTAIYCHPTGPGQNQRATVVQAAQIEIPAPPPPEPITLTVQVSIYINTQST